MRLWIMLGGISGGLSVLLGAFGAHSLKGQITEKSLGAFQTGNQYQFVHSLALILVGILVKDLALFYVVKNRMQAVADLAALGAAQQYAKNLEGSQFISIKTIANEIAAANGYNLTNGAEEDEFEMGEYDFQSPERFDKTQFPNEEELVKDVNPNTDAVRITLGEPPPTTFGKLFNQTIVVEAIATVCKGNANLVMLEGECPCGNGTEGEWGEACDDSNLLPGDGCTSGCLLEAGTPPGAAPLPRSSAPTRRLPLK